MAQAPIDDNHHKGILGKDAITGDAEPIASTQFGDDSALHTHTVGFSPDFDYVGIVNTDTNEDTLTYKSGGSGGTTVRTLVIGYASGAEKVSDSITSLEYN
jgi:hypothetical protein